MPHSVYWQRWMRHPGQLKAIKMRGERSRRLGLSASGYCLLSNPSPGTKISTPVFGYELFVARH
jgi:hypothetical protein